MADWVKEVTDEIRGKLNESSHSAYENGKSLLHDAQILFDNKCFPRAAAVSILAEEEFSKAFILRNCALQGRWDSNIHKAIERHLPKQTISEDMLQYLESVLQNLDQTEPENQDFLEPPPRRKENKLDNIIAGARKILQKSDKDKMKMDSLYVGVSKDGKVKSSPDSIGKDKAKSCLEGAHLIQIITEIQLSNFSSYR